MNNLTQTLLHKAEILAECLPWIQKFHGSIFIIKYGGSAMEDPDRVDAVLADIALLKAIGIRPVLIHGGGKAINRKLEEKGIKSQFIDGLRITDSETMHIVEDILFNTINKDIATRLNKFGTHVESISGRDILHVKKLSHSTKNGKKTDLGFVGDVIACHAQRIKSSLEQSLTPIISPIGDDGKGQAYNVNADIAAAEIAITLNANKLIYLSDVNGILSDPQDPSSTISTITSEDIGELKERGIISSGMLPKVDSSVKALNHSIEKIHFIDANLPHSLLLEILTDHGIGTELIKKENPTKNK